MHIFDGRRFASVVAPRFFAGLLTVAEPYVLGFMRKKFYWFQAVLYPRLRTGSITEGLERIPSLSFYPWSIIFKYQNTGLSILQKVLEVIEDSNPYTCDR